MMKQAGDVKVGDIITLDCGYDMPNFQPCEVLVAKECRDFWGNEGFVIFRVREDHGGEFWTAPFKKELNI